MTECDVMTNQRLAVTSVYLRHTSQCCPKAAANLMLKLLVDCAVDYTYTILL